MKGRLVNRYLLAAASRHAIVAVGAAAIAATTLGPADAQQRTREDAKARAGEAKAAVKPAPTQQEGGQLTGVTFQDVLANPDDPQINFAYAQQLIAEGRLGLASATLERILLLRPDLDEVRLLFAVVQYRIDNLDEARSELKLLLAKPQPPAIQAEAERYLALIETRSKPLKRTASLTFGVHHDDNRNAFPGGGDFLVLGAPVQSTAREEDDWGTIALGNVEYRYDTGGQRIQEVYFNGSLLVDDQIELDNLDVEALLTEVGAVYKSAWATFGPKLGWTYIELSGNKYVSDTWLGLTAERPLSPKWSVSGELRYGVENFSNSTNVPFAAEQDGDYFTAFDWPLHLRTEHQDEG